MNQYDPDDFEEPCMVATGGDRQGLRPFDVIHGRDIAGFEKIKVVDDSWRRVTVYLKDDFALIGFHETFGNWWDWLLNLLAQKVPFHGFMVHMGFLSEYMTFRTQLFEALSGVNHYEAFAFSQGGAHATLFHLDNDRNGVTTTFGSPRCVTKAVYTDSLIHCRFTVDPVWRLPAKPFGWADTGTIVYRKYTGKWTDAHSVGAYSEFFDFPEVKK